MLESPTLEDFILRSVCVLTHFSHVQLCATPWTVARQAPLSMGFSRREYWSGLPFPPPGDRPDPGIKPVSQILYLLNRQGSTEMHKQNES